MRESPLRRAKLEVLIQHWSAVRSSSKVGRREGERRWLNQSTATGARSRFGAETRANNEQIRCVPRPFLKLALVFSEVSLYSNWIGRKISRFHGGGCGPLHIAPQTILLQIGRKPRRAQRFANGLVLCALGAGEAG